MMTTPTWQQKYWDALEDVARWTNRKASVTLTLRVKYMNEGKDGDTIAFLIDKDQEVRGCQVMLDRALAVAAAYGPAALLEKMTK